jgi:hypothetical protein
VSLRVEAAALTPAANVASNAIPIITSEGEKKPHRAKFVDLGTGAKTRSAMQRLFCSAPLTIQTPKKERMYI